MRNFLQSDPSSHSPEEISTAPVLNPAPAAPPAVPTAERGQDLASAFPAWDLLPPDIFVKRVSRQPREAVVLD